MERAFIRCSNLIIDVRYAFSMTTAQGRAPLHPITNRNR